MAETMFDMLDEYVINNIFNILYEDYDYDAVIALQSISDKYDRIGEKYEIKFLGDEFDRLETAFWNGQH